MPDLGFVRAHDLNLSLWQSLVADYVRSVLGDRSSTADVLLVRPTVASGG